MALNIETVGYEHPDAQTLIAQVQQEYVVRYGGPDHSPVDPAQFAPPNGLFVVGYVGREPVAMGGWRRRGPEYADTAWASDVAEIKRMYVCDAARGRGYARTMLTHLEDTAQDAGLQWLVLETGTMQPEAIALYQSSGYLDIAPFGHYAGEPQAIHLGKQLPRP